MRYDLKGCSMELPREKFIALTIGAPALLLIGAYFIFYAPRLSQIERAKKETQALRLQISQSQDAVAQLKAIPSKPKEEIKLESVLPESALLRLSGILWDSTSPHAIVNDMVVGIGEKIENYVITDIRQDRVVL